MSALGYRLPLPRSLTRPVFRCREREPGRLQLRVALRPGEAVFEVHVEEDAKRIDVSVLVVREFEDRGEAVDCPVHVYLKAALGDRRVTDRARGGETVELFVPDW
jgi:hypothetical protein